MLMDKKSGKIALVAHCILNQNSRAFGLAEKSSVITEIVELLARNEIGIIQMPCPELAYAGVLRQPQTKNQYDNLIFRRHCGQIAEESANQIQEYEKCDIKLKLVIGVNESPSCNVAETSKTKETGIFIEKLRFALKQRKITVPLYGIHYERLSEDLIELEKLVRN